MIYYSLLHVLHCSGADQVCNFSVCFPLSRKSVIHLPHLCLMQEHLISVTVNYQHSIFDGVIGDNSLKFPRWIISAVQLMTSLRAFFFFCLPRKCSAFSEDHDLLQWLKLILSEPLFVQSLLLGVLTLVLPLSLQKVNKRMADKWPVCTASFFFLGCCL